MEYINIFNEIGLYKDNLHTYTFDVLSNIISNKVTINSVYKLLRFVSHYYKNNNKKRVYKLSTKKNIKLFLTAYLIYRFPDITITSDKKNNSDVVNECIKLINILEKNAKINEFDINELYNSIVKYIVLLKKWLKKDNVFLIKKLTEQYWEIDYSIYNMKSNEKQPEITQCKNLQKDILLNIKKIGGIDYFNNFVPLFIDDKFLNSVFENLKNTFWEKFKHDLSKEKQDFTMLVDMLKDTRTMIAALVPNRKDIHNELWEVINISLINQMIENEALTPEYIKDLVFYIINKIKIMGSIETEKELIKWEEEVKLKFLDGFLLSEFLPDYFRRVFEYLENIYILIEDIKNNSSIY